MCMCAWGVLGKFVFSGMLKCSALFCIICGQFVHVDVNVFVIPTM